MTSPSPQQWMRDQHALGHTLCLIVDAQGGWQTQPQQTDQHYSVYSETPVADLADAGPLLVPIDYLEDERLSKLLTMPEKNWGWLASVPAAAGLDGVLRHWRARLIVGARPHQALYRFHDNQVLARALKHLSAQAIPAYLGPIVSACYWQGTQWATISNDAPGDHPVPEHPQWCAVPVEGEQSARIREINAHRFLLAEHLQAYAHLGEQQDPNFWLSNLLVLADRWGWQSPEQLKFLLIQSLKDSNITFSQRWQPRPEETPIAHFQRVYEETQFWQGDTPL